MKKVSKKISLMLVLVLFILSVNPLFACALPLQLFGNDLLLTETFTENEETDEFLQEEMSAALIGEEWFVGEDEESTEGGFLAGDEQPEDDSGYTTYNLDDSTESSDLNITVSGITGLMETRRTLANFLDVQWDSNYKFMIQGGCSDGEYVYYAFNSYTISPRETICQKILCAKLSDDGSIFNAAIH